MPRHLKPGVYVKEIDQFWTVPASVKCEVCGTMIASVVDPIILGKQRDSKARLCKKCQIKRTWELKMWPDGE